MPDDDPVNDSDLVTCPRCGFVFSRKGSIRCPECFPGGSSKLQRVRGRVSPAHRDTLEVLADILREFGYQVTRPG